MKISIRGQLTVALFLSATLIVTLMWQLSVAYDYALDNHQGMLDAQSEAHRLSIELEQRDELIGELRTELAE